MRWAFPVIFFGILLCILFTPVSAENVTITASPQQDHIGDVITLSGSVTGISTIAIYLFIIGPGLDTRGVTLENLNIAAGRGLFTTAPVNMTNGSWTYRWDTSVILGTLEPGNYTVYAVSSPVDRFRFQKEGYSTAEIQFLPGNESVTPVPLDPLVPVLAVGIGAILCACLVRIRGKRE